MPKIKLSPQRNSTNGRIVAIKVADDVPTIL